MRRLAQSTAYTVMLKLFLSSDHVSKATGKTVAIKISKAGGAFADPNAGATNATEISDGWYKVALDTTDTNTLGDLVVRGTSASCDDAEQVCQVISATTGGATNLDAAISSRSSHAASDIWAVGTRLLTAGTNIQLPANGLANVTAWTVALTGNITGNLSGSVGSVTGLTASDVGAIKAKTDNLPDDPADESLIIAATNSLAGQISGLNNISQADVRNAVGLASADLDTQLAALSTSAEISDLQTHGDSAWGTATGFSTLDGSDVSAAVWDVAMADHLGAGTTGDAIFQAGVHAPSADTKADTILANLAVTDGKVDAIDTNVDAILVDTGTDIPASIAALNDLSAADVNAEVDQAISDAALATAASLATTDGKVDAVQAKTDQLAFTGGGVSADMRSINGTTLTGDGSTGDKFGPA